jgi:signal transduction histidine kinase/CheY-like chemotaxis protein
MGQQMRSRPIVLVIDDEPDVLNMLRRALRTAYQVEIASNGRDGLALMRTLAPDLVVTDLRMPIMGGDELIATVRSSADLRSTALMVISSDATEEQKVSLLRRGVEDCMLKPISIEELRARISNLLARKRELDALRHALADHEHTALRERFLAQAGDALGASGDPQQTVDAIAGLMLLAFGDVCEVEVVPDRERPAQVSLLGRNAATATACRTIERAAREHGRGLMTWKVVGHDEPVLARTVTAKDLEAIAVDGAHLAALRELTPHSILAVPLRIRGAQLGALAVASSSPALRYEEEDVAVIQQLADKAALALDHAYSLRLAQSAVEQRDRTLAVVTEGLRAPIDRVREYSRLLRRPGGQPERRAGEPIAAIQAAVAEMDRLVSHLSTVKQADAGFLFADRQPTDPAHLVLEAIGLSRHLASACRIELETGLPSDLPEVWLDRSALLSVFADLVENAVRHTPPGGRIRIGAEALERSVRFWVSDTGTGISAEELPYLFEHHAPSRLARGSGRAGLGLMSVRGIIEAHGGKIAVESTVGEGSTFSFLLPRERVLV